MPHAFLMTRPWKAGCLGCGGYLFAFLFVGAVAGFGGFVVPIFAAALSALTLAVCFLFGLFLEWPPLRRRWQRGAGPAALTLATGAALFVFGLWSTEELPPWPEGRDPDEQPLPLPGATTIPGVAVAVFAVAHWPRRRENSPVAIPLA